MTENNKLGKQLGILKGDKFHLKPNAKYPRPREEVQKCRQNLQI